MTWLLNRHTNLLEPAEVVDRIQPEDIDCFQKEWLPPIQSKVNELRVAGQLNPQTANQWNVEDCGWQWPRKFQLRKGVLEWGSLALRCGGKTQGLAFLNLVRRARLPSQLNQHLIYIDLLATAPWNRPRLSPQPIYRGVGTVLVTEVILLSQEEGFEGRVGLHSLPGSESVYRDKFGMDCRGPDAQYDNLLYFELTPQQAKKLLTSP